MELCKLCLDWIYPGLPHTECDEILGQMDPLDALEDEVCDCGHKISDHAGGTLCMICKCGTEEYDHENDEPLNNTPTWTTGPGGMEGYE